MLVLQIVEALPDGLLGKGRHPEPVDRAFRPRLLHHPPLDQLSLLPGIAAVDDGLRVLHELLYDRELLPVCVIVYQLDSKSRRDHRKGRERPVLPLRGVVVRLLEHAQMPEGPGHLIPVTLKIPVHSRPCAEHIGYLPRHARLFRNANLH